MKKPISKYVFFLQSYEWTSTCWRLRLACRADPSFSSCFTLILTISWRNFSFDSLESSPLSSACLRLSSSDSSPSSGGVTGVAMGIPAGAVPSADVTVQMGPWAHGELRSLAELDEVKDGDDREDREEVTVGRNHAEERVNFVEKLDFSSCKN